MLHIKKWKIRSNMFFNEKIQWSVLKERFFNEEYFSMKHSSKNIQWIIISMKSIFNETYGGQANSDCALDSTQPAPSISVNSDGEYSFDWKYFSLKVLLIEISTFFFDDWLKFNQSSKITKISMKAFNFYNISMKHHFEFFSNEIKMQLIENIFIIPY